MGPRFGRTETGDGTDRRADPARSRRFVSGARALTVAGLRGRLGSSFEPAYGGDLWQRFLAVPGSVPRRSSSADGGGAVRSSSYMEGMGNGDLA
jgi:hypothetical protein